MIFQKFFGNFMDLIFLSFVRIEKKISSILDLLGYVWQIGLEIILRYTEFKNSNSFLICTFSKKRVFSHWLTRSKIIFFVFLIFKYENSVKLQPQLEILMYLRSLNPQPLEFSIREQSFLICRPSNLPFYSHIEIYGLACKNSAGG